MNRNIFSLQQDQDMCELIGPFDYIRDMTISLKGIRYVYPNMRFRQQVQVPWSKRLRRRTTVGSFEVNNQFFALI